METAKSNKKITPFLWFNGNVEEAVNFYTGIFEDSKIVNMHRLPGDAPGMQGKILTATFIIRGMEFMILDGGPRFPHSEAISFSVNCDSQAEVDHYWNSLIANGGNESRCGWLKDKYGISWQIIPEALGRLMGDPDMAKAKRVMDAMLTMNKIIVADLEAAYAG